MKLTICILAILLLSLNALPQKTSSGHRNATTKRGTTHIKTNKPHVFISFERQGKIAPLFEGESDSRIWLRFNNNSKWAISICSNPTPIAYGHVELSYEIERHEGVEDYPSSRGSDTCGYLSLRSGQSILFSIPKEHLKKGLLVKVSFHYSWEFDSDGSISDLEPKHFCLFYSTDVPKLEGSA